MNVYLLFFIALIPIIWLMVSLVGLKIAGHKTTPISLIITLILSIVVWKMPVIDSIRAGVEGAAMAIWPIMIVIIAAVFIYNLSLYTKSMDVIKNMMTGITTDQRILVLILAWGFGGFLEAIAGFGTAVAIPASIMAALGFDPIFAAIICLIANTTPTAFGAIGLPVSTLAKVAGLNVNLLSYAVVLQLVILIIVIPMVLVMLTGKSPKAIKGVFGISLVSGLSFAIPELLAGKYMGAELPAILGSVVCLAVTIGWAKIFHKDKASKNTQQISFNKAFVAWIPFILVFVIIIATSSLFPSINKALSSIQTSVAIYNGPGGHPYSFAWLANPGTLIIAAGIIGGLIQGARFNEIVGILGKTARQMTNSAITIISIVALAKIMSYSGMIKSIAVVLVSITGHGYPVIAPIIGALGTFVTGSDTSANILFGSLQVEAAKSLGLNSYWLAAANMGGATAGKMISPQSIAVATAATGLVGAEGKILSATLKFCIIYVIILGLVAFVMGPVFGFN
ncbi:L-lactate permease [Clostridium sp. DJ247]|uniref:L-lactate permease n=1 Tax=Clostridium sp. DJ247 TaxID=2726188 RepID=UPI00162562CF|nr:L-lactate permease [Clostridium sp. DJ247]MBC2580131.1 L-lactate permease [Clostridium sp. DJ247]